MDSNESEACGRCSMTSVVGMTESDDGESSDRDPFAGERIEVSESGLRTAAAPAVVAGRIKHKLDEIATRLTYGQ